MTQHERPAPGRAQQPDRHRQRRRLTGTVRAEQAEERAGGYIEVDPVDRDEAIEHLDQAPHRESRSPIDHSHRR